MGHETESTDSNDMTQPKKHGRTLNEFFSTIYGLTLFTIKSLYILISDSMKKESQTYKEEREEQKRVARKRAKNDASP